MIRRLRSRLRAWWSARKNRRAEADRFLEVFMSCVRFGQSDLKPQLGPDWPKPDSDAARHPLFRWACERMSDRLVDHMAFCDPGYEQNYAELIKIRNTGHVPPNLDFCASEPCSLWQWGAERYRKAHEHTSTIFATSILLIAGAHPECDGGNCVGDGMSNKIASLLWSVIALREVFGEARVFFGWLAWAMDEKFRNGSDGEPSSFALLALVIVHVQQGSPAADVEAAARKLEEIAEREGQSKYLFRNEEPRWAGRVVLALMNYDQHHHLWERMARDARRMLLKRKDAGDMPTATRVLGEIAGE